MIPLLIVPIFRRWDLAAQMLNSIDVPVERAVIVANDQSERTFVPAWHPTVRRMDYLRPLINLGFAGGINAAISQTPDAPWWLWASQDIAFGPGDLTNIAHLIGDAKGPRVVTGDRSDDRLLRCAYAAINRECIEAVGLLDEWTFHPGYYDDDDMEYRCQLGGVEWITYNGAISHERSATIRTDPAAAAGNARTFPMNRQRYIAKWGGPPGSERFSRPWNKPVPLSYAPIDIAGRAERSWT